MSRFRSGEPLLAAVAILAAIFWISPSAAQHSSFEILYGEHCSVCHGEKLEGAGQGTPLAGVELRHGDSIADIGRSIAGGFEQPPMPAWSETLSDAQIQGLAIYVSERRSNFVYSDFNVTTPFEIPTDIIRTELHEFRIETVATGLDPLPFSIAPMPDGSILLVYGLGWMLEVALHPDYADNGWVYLSYGDRCTDCNAASRAGNVPVSMTRLIRGRIREGAWVDEETIWRADIENYTTMVDMVAGGRIAFDGAGHLFLSIGMKGAANYVGIQDLGLPYGKILRINDDGSFPSDNPFVGDSAALDSIRTYGHRSPQGLEYDGATGLLWGTEMGPCGGDEIDLLLPGRNYGWPLYSRGLDHDGTTVEYGIELGIEFDLDDIEQPVIDLTPSPAVSSFIVYEGTEFPEWQHNLIVGTLKATALYRFVLDGDRITGRERLLDGIGRIRDIEVGADGAIYLLLEHRSGSRIVRLVRGR